MQQQLNLFETAKKLKGSFLILAVLLVIERIFRDLLFKISIAIIKEIRSNHATKSLDLFFKIVSEFGDKYVLSLFIVYAHHFLDTPKAFTVCLNAYSSLALFSLLKSIHAEPRPFHVSDIIPTKCDLEYGNPSGHSVISVSLYLTVWTLSSI